jgi:hypothetical protein
MDRLHGLDFVKKNNIQRLKPASGAGLSKLPLKAAHSLLTIDHSLHHSRIFNQQNLLSDSFTI